MFKIGMGCLTITKFYIGYLSDGLKGKFPAIVVGGIIPKGLKRLCKAGGREKGLEPRPTEATAAAAAAATAEDDCGVKVGEVASGS